MKDSGVEWIGEIPSEWDISRVKLISDIKRGSSPRPIDDPVYFDEDGEYSWVRISDVSSCGKYLTTTTQKLSDVGKNHSLPLENETLCMSISGSVGKVFITKIKCCIHDGFVSFNNLKLEQEYLYLLLTNDELYSEDRKLGTQYNINSEIVGNKRIPLPPLNEQHQIVEYLDKETKLIDETISSEHKKIELLKEYKQSLISEVVTGKRKVTTDE
jgi:type I restriction enzyme S subunit